MGQDYDTLRRYPEATPATLLVHYPRRRWPPPPVVEDEEVSLKHEYKPGRPDSTRDEGFMRGSLDQQPMILEVNPPKSEVHNEHGLDVECDGTSLESKSSNESFGPPTPPEGVEQSLDRRYIYIPKKGIEIPLTYDEPIKPVGKTTGLSGSPANAVRGREGNPPKLDTNMQQRKDTEFTPLVTAREPSPYSYPPSPAVKGRCSGEYLLSPDTLSPKVNLPLNANKVKPRKSDGGQTFKVPMAHASGTLEIPATPIERPTFNTHVSVSAYPGQPSHGSSHSQSASDELSSDNSDEESGRYRKVRRDKRSSRDSREWPNRPRHASALLCEENVRRDPNDGHGNIAPPSRPTSAYSARAIPVGVPALGALGPGVANALLADPHWNKPSPASRVSPSTSPYSSPPRTPRVDATRYGETLPIVGSRSRLSSRPTTPTSSDQLRPRSPAFEAFHGSLPAVHPSSNLRPSRTTSQPSPYLDRPSSSSGPRIDVHGPSPANQQTAFTIANNGPRVASRAEAPFILSPAPQMAPRSSSRQRPPTSLFESPPDTPVRGPSPSGFYDIPHPPPQAYASTVKRERTPKPTQTQVVSLSSCPRPTPVAGYHDWYSLDGMPSFNICPTCKQHVVATGYGGHFIPSPSRFHGHETKCDFSNPWVRMAWLLTLKHQRPDVQILYELAKVAVRELPCPGKFGARGPWFHLTDPVAGMTVSNFDVCPYCVRSLETIFPTLHGLFQHMPSAAQHSRICDLRSDSKRFATYVDTLEEIANRAVHTHKHPDTRRFVDLARTMALIRECPRDDMIVGQLWHIMPQIPELTVCEECYDEVVWPLIETGSPLAAQFNRTMQLVAPPDVGVSCQLYSPRMRKLFEEACRRDDFVGLRNAALQRWRVES